MRIRRATANIQNPAWRNELCWASARADGVRGGTDCPHPFLPPAALPPSKRHRFTIKVSTGAVRDVSRSNNHEICPFPASGRPSQGLSQPLVTDFLKP